MVKHKVTHVEKHISALEDDLGKENALVSFLRHQVDDLESCRMNNTIMGLKEDMEANDLTRLLNRNREHISVCVGLG